MINVRLPFPHKMLWPNGRTRSVNGRAAKVQEHRHWAIVGTAEAVGRRRIAFAPDQRIPVHIVVSRKSSGPYPDEDNVVAACKSYLDGIAERLKVNDRQFAAPTVEFVAPCGEGFIIQIGARG